MHRAARRVLLMLATCGAAAASAATGAPGDRWSPPFAGNPCFAPDAAPGHQLEFNAYFDREEDALAVARALPAEVFLLTLRRSVEGHDWILVARYRELPQPSDHGAHSEHIHALARALRGRYPGFVCGGPRYRPGDSPAASPPPARAQP